MMKETGRISRGAMLSLLLFGVTSSGVAAPDDCSEAPFQDVPPSPREWSLLALGSDRFRARLWDSDDWIYFGNPEGTTAGLRARGGEAWNSGRLAYSDSLVVHWEDIERLEASRGSHYGLGVHFGAMAGAAAFVGFHDEGWGWAVFSIPAGMLIGGIIGVSMPIWRAVYCAAPAHPGDSGSDP
jgi:hypothetical protein